MIQWTKDELYELESLALEGWTDREIAEALGKSIYAIRTRAEADGIEVIKATPPKGRPRTAPREANTYYPETPIVKDREFILVGERRIRLLRFQRRESK